MDLMLDMPQSPTSLATPASSEGLRAEMLDAGPRFVTLESNYKAFEAAHLFSIRTQPFVGIFGPTGSGKTHLLATASELSANYVSSVEVASALNWVTRRTRSLAPVLILDDTHEALTTPRYRQTLRTGLEMRFRKRLPTLIAFTWQQPVRRLRDQLPRGNDWYLAAVARPSRDESERILEAMAQQAGLKVDESILRMLARHIDGNGNLLLGALRNLALVKRMWVTPSDALQAAGRLSTFWAESEGWDPRDVIFEAVLRRYQQCETPVGVTEHQLAAYLMLDVAFILEQEVAGFFGWTPGQAYLASQSVQKKLREPEIARFVQECLVLAAAALAE